MITSTHFDDGQPKRLHELPRLWRARVELLRSHGADGHAKLGDTLLAELEVALNQVGMEPLDLAAASAESGFTVGHLRRMLADGTIPDAGHRTILRRHLPRKPGHGLARGEATGASSRSQVARAVVTGD